MILLNIQGLNLGYVVIMKKKLLCVIIIIKISVVMKINVVRNVILCVQVVVKKLRRKNNMKCKDCRKCLFKLIYSKFNNPNMVYCVSKNKIIDYPIINAILCSKYKEVE
jgi:hypothetical protein